MNKREKREALEQLARDRAVQGWAFRLPSAKDKPPQFILDHWAIHEAPSGQCKPCDQVRKFQAGLEEADDIRAFLNGGPCPAKHRSSYDLAREQLKLGHKDWYEAFADAAHGYVPGWDITGYMTDLTDEQEAYCLAAADSVADRPEAEK